MPSPPVFALVSAILILFGLGWRIRARWEASRDSAERAIFLDLRRQLFSFDPIAAGIPDPVPGTFNDVIGIAMEVGYPQGVATLVALGDGTASLYLESGGGAVGAGRHERVLVAATSFVETADRTVHAGNPVDTPPLPVVGETRFHWRLRTGVLSATVSERELRSPGHALTELHRSGNDLLDRIREVAGGST